MTRKNTFTSVICLLTIFFVAQSSFVLGLQSEQTIGNVIHSFANGRMQCLSQIDSTGHTYVLLNSLEENTSLDFIKVTTSKDKKSTVPFFVLEVFMRVQEDTDLCKSWVNAQTVTIKIDPQPVQDCTFKSAKKIYETDKISVMCFPK